MSKISDKIEKRLKAIELREKFKDVKPLKQKLDELKEKNGKLFKPIKKPKVEIPEGFILIKIPKDLNDISIAKLRTLHADIFGKEPPHYSGYDKQWIANKIKAIL